MQKASSQSAFAHKETGVNYSDLPGDASSGTGESWGYTAALETFPSCPAKR